MPQIPSINYWFGTGGGTSERGRDSAVPHVRAIFDHRGHLMVLMTHNTDFGDAFEREGDNHQYFSSLPREIRLRDRCARLLDDALSSQQSGVSSQCGGKRSSRRSFRSAE